MKKTSYFVFAIAVLVILSVFNSCDFGLGEFNSSNESNANVELNDNKNDTSNTDSIDSPSDDTDTEITSDTQHPDVLPPEAEVDPEVYQYLEFTSNGDGTCTLTSIGDYIADHLVIPATNSQGETVTKIGYSALSETNFRIVTIPEGVETILGYAFYECKALEIICIPNTVKSISTYAFHGCNNIKEVHITDMTAWMKMDLPEADGNPFSGGTMLYLNGKPIIDLVIPDDAIRINDFVFSGYEYLQSISTTQNSKLSYIGEEAFSSCPRLMRVVLPQRLTTIKEKAFYNCLRLIEVVNLSSLEITKSNINGYVGYYSIRIENDGAENSRLINKGDFVFYRDEDAYLLVAYFGDDDELVLPLDFEGKDYAINKYFYSSSDVTQITVSNGVNRIGDYAFANKSKLKNVIFESESQLKYIDESAFSQCGLESIVIPSTVEIIGVGAFEKCANLESVSFKENSKLEAIRGQAFYNCPKLNNIIIPATVKYIGVRALSACSDLKSVTFEDPKGWNGIEGSGSYSVAETLNENALGDSSRAATMVNGKGKYTLFKGTAEELLEFIKIFN